MSTGYRASSPLPLRLAAIAERVPAELCVADVGCDHGHLTLALARSGAGREVYGLDRSARALAVARQTLAEARPSPHCVSLAVSDGLTVLRPGQAEVLTIAGMGGHTVVHILSSAESHHPHLVRLLLQPNDHVDLVRQWLRTTGFVLEDELLVVDRGRAYVILQAGALGPPQPAWSELDALFGPLLRHRPGAQVQGWLEAEEARLARAVSAAGRGRKGVPVALARRLELARQALSERESSPAPQGLSPEA